MSRFPSIGTALRHARATAGRFPMAILAGLTATVVMLVIIDGPARDWHGRLLAIVILALPLFTATVTTAERHSISARKRWLADILIAVGLALLYRGSLEWTDRQASYRLAQLLIAAHLIVAVAPYLTGGERRGFWQYNRFLFLRYLVASLYATVLWIGLAVALAALDKLFGADIPSEAYSRLWAVLAFGFHPWFFLSGLPRDYEALDQLDDYPQGLKVFTQFVLIPLVVIYLTILTAYLGKVIVTRTWPSGWIGYLVSSVSVTGVLALLLVHPIRDRADSRWVRGYARWWFVALLPSLVMVLLAIGKRIDQYGITEPRYFLLVLALWLLGLALYFAITGSSDIKRIPLTLAGLAILTTAGPWGAYSVARRSQLGRFNAILAANGMTITGQPATAGRTVSAGDRRELSAIFRYLGEVHGPGAVATAVGVPDDSLAAWQADSSQTPGDRIAAHAMRRLGLPYTSRWETLQRNESFWANLATPQPLDVAGFELALPMSYPGLGWVGNGRDSLQLSEQTGGGGVVVVQHAGAALFTLDLGNAVRDAVPRDSLGLSGMRLARAVIAEGAGAGFRVRFTMESFVGRVQGDTLVLQNATGYVMVSGLPR